MPSSLNGLVLFVILLAPGFVYVSRRSTITAERSPTLLRETAMLVLWSVASCSLALGLFAVVRFALPGQTPDVGRLVRDGTRLRQVWRSTAVAAAAILTVACVIAAVAGKPPKIVRSLLDRVRLTKVPPVAAWLERTNAPQILKSSAWGVAFVAQPSQYTHVGIELTDGTYVEGYLRFFNPDEDDSSERSLVLSWPLALRRADTSVLTALDKDHIVIAAGMIRFLLVTYTETSAPSPSVVD